MELNAVQALKQKARILLQTEFIGSVRLARSISLGIGTTEKVGDFVLAVRIRSVFGSPVLVARVKKWFVERVTSAANLDVMYTGPVYINPPQNAAAGKDSVLRIGSSIGHYTVLGGTLGFFATSNDDHSVGLVSANHVIAALDKAADDSAIIHPSYADGGTNCDRVAGMTRYVALRGDGEKFVDCAFAKLDKGQKYNAIDLGKGRELQKTLGDPKDRYDVFKIGRKTKETSGCVRSFDFDCFEVFNYDYDLFDVPFDDQIEVESNDPNLRFSDDGDSGALVFNGKHQAVGLLFAETRIGGTHNTGLAYVNPIARVLSELKIDLYVPNGDQQQP